MAARRRLLVVAVVVVAAAGVVKLGSMLSGTAVIKGRVVEAGTGIPLPGARVQASGSDGHHAAVTDAAGRFRLEVKPGLCMFWLDTLPAGYLPSSEGWYNNHLRPGQAWNVGDLEAERIARIKGKVLEVDGSPALGATVLVVGTGSTVHLGPGPADSGLRGSRWVATKKGEFAISVDPRPNPYDPQLGYLGSRAPHPTITLVGMSRDRKHMTHVRVALPDGAITPVILRLAPPASARGEVLDEQGRPVANATVVLGSSAHGRRGKTDPVGTFRVGGLVPGLRCSVSVAADGFLNREHHFFTPDSGQVYHVPSIRLERNDSFVAGVVTDTNGTPIPEVWLDVWRHGERVKGDWVVRGRMADGKTDSQGRFTLRNVTGGKVHLRVHCSPAGHGAWEGDVIAGQSNLRVILPPAAAPDAR